MIHERPCRKTSAFLAESALDPALDQTGFPDYPNLSAMEMQASRHANATSPP